MLSVICLEEIHLCEMCTHLMVYQWRPRQIAVVSVLQSQLHSVSGRKASGDFKILPRLSTSEDLGINTVLLSAKSAGIVPLQHMFVCVEQNLRTQSSSTPFKSCMGFHQGQSRFLLCGHELVKLVSVDFPADVVRSFVRQDLTK